MTKILPLIEERCDALEFEGSRIYDEEPDAQMLREEAQRLYERIRVMQDDASMTRGDAAQPADTQPVRDGYTFSFQPPEGMEVPALTAQQRGTNRPPQNPPRPPQGPGRPPMGPQGPSGNPGMPPHRPQQCGDDWLCSMVGVLLQNELYRRRCRYRRCHRWW